MEPSVNPDNINSDKSEIESSKVQRFRAAEHVRRSQEKIKNIWEAKVREQVLEAEGTTSLALIDSLPIFLDELIVILTLEGPIPESVAMLGMARAHGGHRATIHNYTLSQVLKEFSIIREVIVFELQSNNDITHEIRSRIDKAVDEASSLAVTEFERIQVFNIKTALTKAESSNRDLEQFALMAAHDLNSPLATVSGLLGLLIDDLGPEINSKQLEYISDMQQTLGQMRSLIGSLLEYSSLIQVRKPFQTIPMNEIAKAAVQGLRGELEKFNVKVNVDSLPTVSGDRDLLIQVFQNLVGNAIKFRAASNPEIRIKAEEMASESWLFSVQDNGVGFDPKNKEEIFDLYKRLHNKVQVPGSGIGLAICRKVVEMHGGKIWAESSPGQGSVFFFTLPKAGAVLYH